MAAARRLAGPICVPVKGSPIPALARRNAEHCSGLRAGVGQASREETAECPTGAQVGRHRFGAGARALGINAIHSLAEVRARRRRRARRPVRRTRRRTAGGHNERARVLRGSAAGTAARARSPTGEAGPASRTRRPVTAPAWSNAMHERKMRQRRSPGVQHQGRSDAGTHHLVAASSPSPPRAVFMTMTPALHCAGVS